MLYPGFSPVKFRLRSPNVKCHYLFSFSFSVASLALLAFFSACKRFFPGSVFLRKSREAEKPVNKVENNTRTRLLQDNGLKQDGGQWTMVEREEISDLKASVDVDIYRDTALRYLDSCPRVTNRAVMDNISIYLGALKDVDFGYANEFGEAFRTHIPRLMYLGSYGIASTYCLADSIDKGRRCYQQNNHLNNYLQKRKAVETSVEAAIWQGLASVIIPGFTINRICATSRFTLRRVARTMPPRAQTWVTTFVGLSAIPLIIKPIDGLVDKIMDGLIDLSRQLGISHQLDHSHK